MKTSLIPLAACLCLSVAGCATPQIQEREPHRPYTLTKDDQAFIIEGMKRQLKDPDSAKFEFIGASIGTVKNIVTVCGRVNSKNSFGGYVGMSPYIGFYAPGTMKVFTLGFISTDAFSANNAIEQCKADGVAVF